MEAKLIECPNCKKMMSNQAEKCPHCGSLNGQGIQEIKEDIRVPEKTRPKKSKKKLIIIIAVVVIIIIVIAVASIAGGGNKIDLVKNGIMNSSINPKGVSLETVLKKYAENGQITWKAIKDENNQVHYVNAEFTAVYENGNKSNIVIQFTINSDSSGFQLNAMEFDGQAVSEVTAMSILSEMYSGQSWSVIVAKAFYNEMAQSYYY